MAKHTQYKLRAVSAEELSALLVKLETGERIVFFASCDAESGKGEDLYGATVIDDFESYAIYINCFGGGAPLIIDISTYDSGLKEITQAVNAYFDSRDPSRIHVYVDASLLSENNA